MGPSSAKTADRPYASNRCLDGRHRRSYGPEKVRLRDRFRFVTDGLSSALAQARAAAGEKDVVIMGGGAIASAFLRAGLVEVLSIHLAPVVLGDGTPLWPAGAPLSLQLLDSESTSAAEHLTYRVINDAVPGR